jgi:hypothetical protein
MAVTQIPSSHSQKIAFELFKGPWDCRQKLNKAGRVMALALLSTSPVVEAKACVVAHAATAGGCWIINATRYRSKRTKCA